MHGTDLARYPVFAPQDLEVFPDGLAAACRPRGFRQDVEEPVRFINSFFPLRSCSRGCWFACAAAAGQAVQGSILVRYSVPRVVISIELHELFASAPLPICGLPPLRFRTT